MGSELITSNEINAYCDAFSTPESPILKTLREETFNSFTGAHMICGEQVGGLLKMLVRLKQPKLVVDIGSFTGYSAICMGEVLPSDAKLISLDQNKEAQDFAQTYLDQTLFTDQVEFRCGKAIELLSEIEGSVDFAFIDADKVSYIEYYEACISKMKPGGMVVADNALFSADVIKEDKGKTGSRIHAFNEHVSKDPRVSSVLLPVRDGVNIIFVV